MVNGLAEWKETAILEFIDIIGGGTPKTSIADYWNGEIPWLSVKDFNNDNRYVYDTEKHISDLGLNNSSTKLLQRDDIIISARGTVGEIAMIPYPMAFNQSCYGIRAKAGTDKSFLYYLLKYKIADLKRMTHGSVFDTITRDTFANLIVSLPPYEIQRGIASVLMLIDDKIECNSRINDNLQQQAKSLYEEMFLNNPDADMVSGTLSDIATITMGQSPSGSSYNEESVGEIFYQGRAEFGFRFPSRRLFTTEPKRMAEPGDVLLSVRAPVGDLNVAYEKCCIGRGLGAIHSKTGDSSFMLYTMFALKPQLDVFNGEGTVFGSINRDGLSNLPVNIPSAEEIAKFEATVRPMDNLIRTNYEEICRLQSIRDSLLPKLMSGEIDVSDIQL